MCHWTHFIQGGPWGAREQKSIKTKLSTTKQRHSHFAGVKTSITENQDQWAKYTRQGIPRDYWTAASHGDKARIPVGRSSKTLGQPIEAELQCNRAADSWAGILEVARPPSSSRHFLRAEWHCQGGRAWHTAKGFLLQDTHCDPACSECMESGQSLLWPQRWGRGRGGRAIQSLTPA